MEKLVIQILVNVLMLYLLVPTDSGGDDDARVSLLK